MKFIPDTSSSAPTKVNATSYGPASASSGLHDSLRGGGPVSLTSKLNGRHPLEARLENWEETQMDFKLQGLQRTYGAGEPIRRSMEMEIVKSTHHVPEVLSEGRTTTPHRTILENHENDVEWEDVYPGENNQFFDFHSEMEKKMGI